LQRKHCIKFAAQKPVFESLIGCENLDRDAGWWHTEWKFERLDPLQFADFPVNVIRTDAVAIAQEPPDYDRGRHVIFLETDRLSLQVLRREDVAVSANKDRRVTKCAREEDGNKSVRKFGF